MTFLLVYLIITLVSFSYCLLHFRDSIQRGSGLAAVAASTTRSAAHGSLKFALPLLRASAAIAPNRMLYVGIFFIDTLFQYVANPFQI